MKEYTMRSRILALLPLIVAVGNATAQQPTPKRALKPEDFARFKSVGDPQLSPDGQWVAYTVSTTDLKKDKSDTDVWMISWDGATNLKLTSSPESESSPRWSPDGKYLAFTSGRQDGKGGQVWLLDRRGGEASRITEIKGGVSSYTWSPDASRLAVLVRDADTDTAENKTKPIVIDRYQFKSDSRGYLDRRRNHIYLFDVASRKLDSLTIGDFDDSNARWSPDGKLLAFSSNREGEDPDRTDNTDIYVVEAKKGAIPRRLTTWGGSDSGPVAWSPDGKWIAYYQGSETKMGAYNQNTLALISVNGGEPRLLATSLDRDPAGGEFTPDGKYIYITVTDDLKRYLARVSVADGKVEKIAVANRTVGGFNMLPNGRLVASVSTTTQPSEIFAFEKGDYRRLTHVNDAFLDSINVATGEGYSAKTKDGVEVHGMFYKPTNYEAGRKYPLLVRIHGGPNSQDAYDWSFEKQLFATNGYAVLSPNYRGSNGRGRAWKEAIWADWGNLEVVDVLASTDWAVQSGVADPNRLGIGGWSYGCITTDYTIASDTRFKAATCGAGVASPIALYGVDQYILQYDNELGAPWKNKDVWIKLAYPLFHADRIKTPTLFLGGQNDFNVPLVGGEQMYQALKSLGVPTQLIIYPGERHGISKPSFVKDRYERYLAWYAKYLGDKAVSATKLSQ
jgi:dipeptidyl aminopeptidase/acylaminoacyl peptidase